MRKAFATILIALPLALLPSVSMAATTELLTDPGFDTDSDGNGIADGWQPYGPNQSWAAGIQTVGAASNVGQVVNGIKAGDSYDLVTDYRLIPSGRVYPSFVLKVEWRDSTNTLITYVYATDNSSSTLQHSTQSYIAPANAAIAIITFTDENANGDMTAVNIDNASFTDQTIPPSPTPTPTPTATVTSAPPSAYAGGYNSTDTNYGNWDSNFPSWESKAILTAAGFIFAIALLRWAAHAAFKQGEGILDD